MTHIQATRLLDLVKRGIDVPDDVVTEALYMTGDGPLMNELPNPEMEAFIQAMREAGQL